MPSYSIIIPFKTGKLYLLECIQSVLAQTYTQFEIIVLSDPTSNLDGSIDAVKALNNPKIAIVESKVQLDILGNWDRIKALSTCEYMTILGYDDILYPHFLATITQLIEKHPNASLFHTHFDYINKEGALLNTCKPLPENLNAETYLEMALKDQISVMATGYVFKNLDYVKVGGINIQYPNLIYADLQLWIDITQLGYLATSTQTQFAFRIHASTTKISKDIILLDALLVFLDYLKKLSKVSSSYHLVIMNNAGIFLEQTTKSIAHRLLRTPVEQRQGLNIKDIVNHLHFQAKALGVTYTPEKMRSFRWALKIEQSSLLSALFLAFKRIYKKPIY